MTKLDLVVFTVGIALLIVSSVTLTVVWVNMSQELRALWNEQVSVIGDVLWISLLVGIIVVAIGYWLKT